MNGRFRQQGLSLVALIVVFFVVIIVAVFGMKIVPSFIEFRAAKKAIEAIAREQPGSSPAEVRRAFEMRSAIDDISSVKPADLDVTKEGGANVISFSYRKEVAFGPSFGVYINYAAAAGGQ